MGGGRLLLKQLLQLLLGVLLLGLVEVDIALVIDEFELQLFLFLLELLAQLVLKLLQLDLHAARCMTRKPFGCETTEIRAFDGHGP